MVFVAILLGFWLPLSGHYDVSTTALGVVSVGVVIFLAQRMRLLAQGQHTLALYRRLPVYAGWLPAGQIMRANCDVAWRILHPGLPINPGFVRVATTQKRDLVKTIYANSITLTPGTISTSVDADTMEIHVLTLGPTSTTALQALERHVSKLEVRSDA